MQLAIQATTKFKKSNKFQSGLIYLFGNKSILLQISPIFKKNLETSPKGQTTGTLCTSWELCLLTEALDEGASLLRLRIAKQKQLTQQIRPTCKVSWTAQLRNNGRN